MDGIHDLGGLQGFGPVRTPDAELISHEPWEVRAQVLALLSGSGQRSEIERLDPATYLASSYYVRWLRTAERTLVARGDLGVDDLERWREAIAADRDLALPVASDPSMVQLIADMGPHVHGQVTSSAFAVGDAVRVRRMREERHHRCPRYVRGARGEVERICGADPHPAIDGAAPEPVYTVRFESTALFGVDTGPNGAPPHALYIDLWERYLESP